MPRKFSYTEKKSYVHIFFIALKHQSTSKYYLTTPAPSPPPTPFPPSSQRDKTILYYIQIDHKSLSIYSYYYNHDFYIPFSLTLFFAKSSLWFETSTRMRIRLRLFFLMCIVYTIKAIKMNSSCVYAYKIQIYVCMYLFFFFFFILNILVWLMYNFVKSIEKYSRFQGLYKAWFGDVRRRDV